MVIPSSVLESRAHPVDFRASNAHISSQGFPHGDDAPEMCENRVGLFDIQTEIGRNLENQSGIEGIVVFIDIQ